MFGGYNFYCYAVRVTTTDRRPKTLLRTLSFVTDSGKQFKILHRLLMGHTISPLCTKCHTDLGTFYPGSGAVWHVTSQDIYVQQVNIKQDLRAFILGLSSQELTLHLLPDKLVDKRLLLARKCILINWIKDNPPTFALK